jgi:hypothetical protein
VRKLPEHPVLTVTSPNFGALSEPERRALRRWITEAWSAGIDDVVDLTGRDWPGGVSGTVIGIFVPGDEFAAWLAVGQNGSWAIASCLDGTVSEPVESLADALAIVYRAGEGSG